MPQREGKDEKHDEKRESLGSNGQRAMMDRFNNFEERLRDEEQSESHSNSTPVTHQPSQPTNSAHNAPAQHTAEADPGRLLRFPPHT